MHLPYQTDHCGSRGSDSLPSRSAGGERRASLASPALLGKQHQITTPPPVDKAAQLRRLERFELHAIVRKVLSSSYVKDRKGTPQERKVIKCLHTPRSKFVEVWKSAKNGLHYYGGLVVCGDVWSCPLCAQKVSEYRGEEIKQAVESWEAQGGSVAMLTQTFPHYENQRCAPLLEKFGKARILMKKRPSYKTLMRQIGLVGNINRTEVTYGANGWHIHSHTLLFIKGNVRLTSGALLPLWASACEAVGLPSPSRAHGIKISTPKEVADYIAKQGKETSNWTIDKEMTKGHIKRGGMEGMTPFDLLRAYRDTKEERFADLFREYSQAFRGKRQLVWSRGLRDLLALAPELTDEEAATSTDELDELLQMIPAKLWDYIRTHNFRGKLLEAANLGKDIFRQALDVLQTCAGYAETPF
jgi:hypothetical protein